MAICTECNQEMTTATGCSAEQFDDFSDKVVRDRIRFGDETRFGPWGVERGAVGTRCHDCGVEFGQFHHPGCDVEECPRCHRQAISCDCCAGKEATP